MYYFSVYYTTNGSFELDDEFEELAGVEPSGTGTFLPTMERDIGFEFDTKQEAEAAYARIEKAIKKKKFQKKGARVDECGLLEEEGMM